MGRAASLGNPKLARWQHYVAIPICPWGCLGLPLLPFATGHSGPGLPTPQCPDTPQAPTSHSLLQPPAPHSPAAAVPTGLPPCHLPLAAWRWGSTHATPVCLSAAAVTRCLPGHGGAPGWVPGLWLGGGKEQGGLGSMLGGDFEKFSSLKVQISPQNSLYIN